MESSNLQLYDFKILRVVNALGRDSPDNAITLVEIEEALPKVGRKSHMSTYKYVRKLADNGYLNRGFCDGLIITYYISDKGQKFLKSVCEGK